MTNIILFAAMIALATSLGACRGPSSPPQSPTNDTQPPITTTGNGEVLGADRVSPATKLEESPTLDTQGGVKPAATPTHD